jgi:quercetin dioxygenase-like cupin family protein
MTRQIETRKINMEEVAPGEINRYWKQVVISDESRQALPGGKGWNYIAPETSGALTINAGMFEMAPHSGMGPTDLHSHSQEEFGYIVAGRGWIAVEDEMHHFQAGDFVFVPAFARHGWYNDGDEPLRVLFYRPIKPEPPHGEQPFDLRRFKVRDVPQE